MEGDGSSGQAEGTVFERLREFIDEHMSMSHVYQPLMLIELLRGGGVADTGQIARAFLAHDESQVEYYEAVVRRYPGRVLSEGHGVTERYANGYRLKGFAELSALEVEELAALCARKLEDYVAARGERIWDHRRTVGRISPSDRYHVLKRAKYRCELCGVSAAVRPIDADHIQPRGLGGSHDPANLQALCSSCNRAKRDRDDTDFRGIDDLYRHREEGCPFCDPSGASVVGENELALALRDLYPVTDGHTLVVGEDTWRATSGSFDRNSTPSISFWPASAPRSVPTTRRSRRSIWASTMVRKRARRSGTAMST